jgi:hypothetical protein
MLQIATSQKPTRQNDCVRLPRTNSGLRFTVDAYLTRTLEKLPLQSPLAQAATGGGDVKAIAVALK